MLCKKYDKYLIVDEVYLPLTWSNTSYLQAKALDYDKIVIVSSFSKYWAVPGWRVGWILSSEKIISDLIKLQSCIYTCAPTAGMELCTKLLRKTNNGEIIDLNILDKSKVELENLFISKGWELVRNKDRSMYIFPVNKHVDIDNLIEILITEGLGVISGKAFGYKSAIRITLPNNNEILERMISIIKKCL